MVARAFADLYRGQRQEFPAACREADYEKRIKAAYPIHPEIFDRLYTDWSTLVKFQRTRGVLRLMAAVIHCLWEKGDANPLILPANIAIDDPRVQFELTRYLPENWVPVIEKDVDGSGSLPLRMDGDVPNLGKFSACRRVARTIYLGSAPTAQAAHQGIEDRSVKLGCVMPGESPAVFGDALRRLAGAATYLYQDGGRYWYSVRPTVTKLAEDRAEQLRSDPDKVAQELDARLRADLRNRGRLQAGARAAARPGRTCPTISTRGSWCWAWSSRTAGTTAAPPRRRPRRILESRGSAPRIYRNTLVFLAADKTRLQDLDEAVQALPGVEVHRRRARDPRTHPGTRQAGRNPARRGVRRTVTARLPETYQWLLVPVQASPDAAIEWSAIRLTGQDALAVRASKKLKSDELLVTGFAGTLLRMELDRVPLWRGDHVPVQQVVEDFARYPYLPRLSESSVLLKAAGEGVGLLTWQQDAFAFADSFDDDAGRYRGLRGGQVVELAEAAGLLVKPDVARRQMDDESLQPAPSGELGGAGSADGQPVPGGGLRKPGEALTRTRWRPAADPVSMAPWNSMPPASAATPARSPTKSSPTSPA